MVKNPIEKTKAAPALPGDEAVEWSVGTIFFLALHAATVLAFWTGWSPAAVIVAAATYGARMFGITAGYHRYFSHASYKTGRVSQFLLALLGASAAQKGPLWWAGHHRNHHLYADTDKDVHSPVRRGFWWSHVGWILSERYGETEWDAIRQFSRFPELRLLDRWHGLAPVALAAALYALGAALARTSPGLRTNGPQMLVWGFVISTVALYHATFSINSLAHRWGTRRYPTPDDSRNNLWLALATMGEGWHNNHHHRPYAERQGERWWEIDATHYILEGLRMAGVIWSVRSPAPPEPRARSGAVHA